MLNHKCQTQHGPQCSAPFKLSVFAVWFAEETHCSVTLHLTASVSQSAPKTSESLFRKAGISKILNSCKTYKNMLQEGKKKIETDLLDTNEFTLQRDTIISLKWKRSQFAS